MYNVDVSIGRRFGKEQKPLRHLQDLTGRLSLHAHSAQGMQGRAFSQSQRHGAHTWQTTKGSTRTQTQTDYLSNSWKTQVVNQLPFIYIYMLNAELSCKNQRLIYSPSQP